jgi:hypothetical protein
MDTDAPTDIDTDTDTNMDRDTDTRTVDKNKSIEGFQFKIWKIAF